MHVTLQYDKFLFFPLFSSFSSGVVDDINTDILWWMYSFLFFECFSEGIEVFMIVAYRSGVVGQACLDIDVWLHVQWRCTRRLN